MPHRFKLFAFDLDGTLVNSLAAIVGSMNTAFESKGLAPPSVDGIKSIIGLNLEVGIARLAPQGYGQVEALSEAYKTAFWESREANTNIEDLFKGTKELIQTLDQVDNFLCICTGKNIRGLEMILETHQLTAHFFSLHTPDSAAGKPHPEMVYQAMKGTGCSPAQTVVIGDSIHDMQMAKNAGVTAVGVSWGYNSVRDLRATGADAIIKSWDELETVLELL